MRDLGVEVSCLILELYETNDTYVLGKYHCYNHHCTVDSAWAISCGATATACVASTYGSTNGMCLLCEAGGRSADQCQDSELAPLACIGRG